MRYRSRLEIISMILQAATRDATITRIMYSAYLSHGQVKEYLAFLEAKGMVRYELGSQTYGLTDKGLHFLRVFEEIRELITMTEEKEEQTVDASTAKGAT